MITSFHTHPQASQHNKIQSALDASEQTNEIESNVAFIVSTIGNGYNDYYQACEMYNSVFFRDEKPEFTLSLCKALINHFPGKINTFWNKVVSDAAQ